MDGTFIRFFRRQGGWYAYSLRLFVFAYSVVCFFATLYAYFQVTHKQLSQILRNQEPASTQGQRAHEVNLVKWVVAPLRHFEYTSAAYELSSHAMERNLCHGLM